MLGDSVPLECVKRLLPKVLAILLENRNSNLWEELLANGDIDWLKIIDVCACRTKADVPAYICLLFLARMVTMAPAWLMDGLKEAIAEVVGKCATSDSMHLLTPFVFLRESRLFLNCMPADFDSDNVLQQLNKTAQTEGPADIAARGRSLYDETTDQSDQQTNLVSLEGRHQTN
eukprot:Colp12_sorted_trinity150504_noHs@34208